MNETARTPGMVGRALARARLTLGDALLGVREAPVEVAATLAVALAFSWALEMEGPAFRAWWELAVPAALLGVVAWTGTLLHALGAWSARRRWTWTLAGAAVIGVYGVVLADFRYAAEGWRAGLLLAGAVAWLVALPAFGGPRATRVARMRRVDGRFTLRVIAALLYGAALYAGLALALRAVDVLFELGLEGTLYGHVWGWIFFVLVPWIVLGGLPFYVDDAAAADRAAGAGADAGAGGSAGESGVAAVARRIALFLVPPLLGLYTVILYAYVVRILVTGELPKNLVSPMVLAAGALAVLALLLFDPRPRGAALDRALRLAPALFLPLAPLGAWALVVRIDQYGWTEFRVVRLVAVAVLAALALAATAQLARRRPFSLHVAPAALAAALLLAAVGPWSALAISRRSQESRLVDALERVGIAVDDTTRAPASPIRDPASPRRPGAPAPALTPLVVPDDTGRVVPAAAYEQIRESARYLVGHFGGDALPPVLRRYARGGARWRDYAAALGLRPDSVAEEESRMAVASLPRDTAVTLGGRTAYRVSWHAPPTRRRGDTEHAPEAGDTAGAEARAGARIALRVGGVVVHPELDRLLAGLAAAEGPATTVAPGPGRGGRRTLPPQRLVVPLTDSAGVRVGELLVWDIMADLEPAGRSVRSLEGLAVLGEEPEG